MVMPIVTEGDGRARRLVVELLRYAAESRDSDLAEATSLGLIDRSDGPELHQVLEAGMAPLLYRAMGGRAASLPVGLRELLLGADLTARVRHGKRVETALEIVDVCNELSVSPTLLKGISISEEYYPAPHLRPMGDIDMLVPRDAGTLVESALRDLGYREQPGYRVGEHAAHGVPLCHPVNGIWVEIHTALFSRESALGRAGVFSRADLGAQALASVFHGRPVYRLTGEMQLVYRAASWVKDLAEQGFHPSLLVFLFDALYLLERSADRFHWNELPFWVDNEMALASLYLLLAYLHRHGLWSPPDSLLPHLASSQRIIGPLELGLIHAMLDRYLLDGKPFTRVFSSTRVWTSLQVPGKGAVTLFRLPWHILFPPTSPERFTWRYQLERIPRLLRRLGVIAGRRPS